MTDNHNNAESGKGGAPDGKAVQVHFRHLGEREVANFKVQPTATLQSIWDVAYGKLEIDKDPRDVLQAPRPGDNPVSLMDHLSLTLAQAQASNLCDTHFEIAAGTGGA